VKIRTADGGGCNFDDNIVWVLKLWQRNILDSNLEWSLVVESLHGALLGFSLSGRHGERI